MHVCMFVYSNSLTLFFFDINSFPAPALYRTMPTILPFYHALYCQRIRKFTYSNYFRIYFQSLIFGLAPTSFLFSLAQTTKTKSKQKEKKKTLWICESCKTKFTYVVCKELNVKRVLLCCWDTFVQCLGDIVVILFVLHACLLQTIRLLNFLVHKYKFVLSPRERFTIFDGTFSSFEYRS